MQKTTVSDLELWQTIRQELEATAHSEPLLASFVHLTVLRHAHLHDALAFHLSSKLLNPVMDGRALNELFQEAYREHPELVDIACEDIRAHYLRDPACHLYSTPFLFFKGFHAIQSYRITHWLWHQGRKTLALFLQNCISETMSIDIHPAAKIGRGIMLDHGTGFVVGETAVIGNNVSILHGVTLGGSGKEGGDRHPKIADGVLIGAGTNILGNIHVGEGAKIGAGSVVLESVPAHTTAVGVPARLSGSAGNMPALEMNHALFDVMI